MPTVPGQDAVGCCMSVAQLTGVDEPGEDLIEAVVQVEGRGVFDLCVDEALVQLGGGLIGKASFRFILIPPRFLILTALYRIAAALSLNLRLNPSGGSLLLQTLKFGQ